MTRAGLVYPFILRNGTPVEVVWSHTDAGIEIRSACDACGFVELDAAERERAVMMIEAECGAAEISHSIAAE